MGTGRKDVAVAAVGAALMGGCGAALNGSLHLHGGGIALLPGFAVGIILLAQAPAIRLSARVRELEARLASNPETRQKDA